MPERNPSSFLTGHNADYIAELHARYLEDPTSVDESWRQFFAELQDQPESIEMEVTGPGWGRPAPMQIVNGHAAPVALTNGHAAEVLPPDAQQAALDSLRAMTLIRAYRTRGHLIADLDPLGLQRTTYHPDLDPATYGFTEDDYNRPIFVNNRLGFKTATLKERRPSIQAT